MIKIYVFEFYQEYACVYKKVRYNDKVLLKARGTRYIFPNIFPNNFQLKMDLY